MLCNFCNIARLDNEAPCPNCGAPSPLRGSITGTLGSTGAFGTMDRGMAQQNAAFSFQQAPGQAGYPFAVQPQQVPYASFEQPTGASFFSPVQTPQDGGQVQLPFPSQPLPPFQPAMPSQPLLPLQESPTAQQSLLPAIYHGGASNSQERGMMMMPAGMLMDGSGALVPTQDTGGMLSTIPLNEGAVYVAPMYTKPRPLIPRYRAISGLISMLIVVLLACGTAGYYAKTSNQFAGIRNIFGLSSPQNEKPVPTVVPQDPQQNPDYGPAAKIITSAATNSRIDMQSYVSEQPSKVFQIGQTIYLTYSVQPPKNSTGTLLIQWYTNNTLYLTTAPKAVTADPKNAGAVLNGYATQAFSQPVAGKVVLLWNNQPGITLYFVVR